MVFHFFQSSAVITKLTDVEIDSCLKTATEEKEDQTDLNVSTGSLPALSQVDQDEESLHEPFANSTFATSEIKESTAVRKSPSNLKPKRSSFNWKKSIKRSTTSTSFQIPFEQRRFFKKIKNSLACLKVMNGTKAGFRPNAR